MWIDSTHNRPVVGSSPNRPPKYQPLREIGFNLIYFGVHLGVHRSFCSFSARSIYTGLLLIRIRILRKYNLFDYIYNKSI